MLIGLQEEVAPTFHIFVAAEFKIRGSRYQHTAPEFTLQVPTTLCRTAHVSVDLEGGTGSVSLVGVPISSEQLEWLKENIGKIHGNEFPEIFSTSYAGIRKELGLVSENCLAYVKYFVGRDEIAEEPFTSISAESWSEDGNLFHSFPTLMRSHAKIRQLISLTPSVVRDLQDGINKGIKPFIAMRHLYRAVQEKNARFKWIDATIAAELAIKEALIRKNPMLSDILITLPSPPLSTLYGTILEKYCGEASPYKNKLKDGTEKRNKLVHRPEETPIESADADDYIRVVTAAIHHLYKLLYPDWEIVTKLCELDHFWRDDQPNPVKGKRKGTT